MPLAEELKLRAKPRVYLFRAGAAHVRAHVMKTTPEGAARQLFGHDTVTNAILERAVIPILERAATSQATTTGTSWASALAHQAIDDTIAAAASLSAGADVIARGTRVNFDNAGSIRIPGRTFAASNADAGQWVGEGAAIPVRSLNFTSGVTLTPKKMAVIVVFSREQAESSAIEQISRAMISEGLGLALDSAMFGNAAGDATRPPGLLYNVNPIAAATGGGTNAMMTDIGALIEALASAHGGKTPLFVMAPKEAAALKLVAGPHFDYPVIASASLAAGEIIAVELASFVSAFDATPDFDIVQVAEFHAEDTSPTDITGGTPSPAVPVRSLFQTHMVGLKMILHGAWGLRAPGHVQYIAGASW
jgi:hypothetical protein